MSKVSVPLGLIASKCGLRRTSGVRGEPGGAARYGVQVLFDPDAPYEARLPSWAEVTAALSATAMREAQR